MTSTRDRTRSQTQSRRPRQRSETTGRGSQAEDQQRQLRKRSAPTRVKGAHIITEHIDVGVPNQTAFDTWTDYGKWSRIFKKESASVRSNSTGSSGRRVKVDAKIGPSQRQWETEITESERGRRLSWRSKGGVQALGTTSFHRLDDRLTRVMVEIEYRPTGFVEVVGNFFRMQRRRVRRDLRLFKHHVELNGGRS